MLPNKRVLKTIVLVCGIVFLWLAQGVVPIAAHLGHAGSPQSRTRGHFVAQSSLLLRHLRASSLAIIDFAANVSAKRQACPVLL